MAPHTKRDRYGLTFKQRAFADEFLVTRNSSLSYLKIYKCLKSSAEVAGSKLLDNFKVRKYVDDRVEAASTKIKYKYDVSKERIYKELERLAFYDLRQLVDEDGRIVPIRELSDDAAAIIEGIDKDGVYKIPSKKAALQMLLMAEGHFEKHQRAGRSVTVIKVPDVTKEDGAGT